MPFSNHGLIRQISKVANYPDALSDDKHANLITKMTQVSYSDSGRVPMDVIDEESSNNQGQSD